MTAWIHLEVAHVALLEDALIGRPWCVASPWSFDDIFSTLQIERILSELPSS